VKTLIILDEWTENVTLSARNLPNVRLIRADSLNIYDILVAQKIVTTPSAIEKIKEVYSD
jgi:LSU ribosomal protein L4P